MSDITLESLTHEDWASMGMVEKREDLVYLFRTGQVDLSKSGPLEIAYQEALESCILDKGSNEDRTILHFLIRTTEPHHVVLPRKWKAGKFSELVDLCLIAISSRLGEKGLYDALHRAIRRKHFKLVEIVCKNIEDPKLARLISEGISFPDNVSKQNCLREIIRTDPPNISLVKTLVHCADSKAFQTDNSRHEGDGNTPLHDFVSFEGTILKVNRCTCQQCKKDFPNMTRDEKEYTEEYVQVLKMMIAEYPDALFTTNKKGQTPYTLYKETRPPFLHGEPSDELEFNSAVSPQGLDAALQDTGTTAGNPLLPDGLPTGNRLRRSSTSLGQDPKTKKPMSKKGSLTTDTEPQLNVEKHQGWDHSRYLAQRAGIELLESSCSLPSWDKASQAIFGNPADGQSTFQTHLKMEEALYTGIHEAHNFLKFNSILACVDLRLSDLRQESASDEDTFDTMDSPVRHPTSSLVRKMTPEQTRDGNERYLADLFKWLCDKGVKRILKLVIADDQELQCRDETIQDFLKGWDVRYLDWNKQDLSVDVITAGEAGKLTELWLTWSGRNSVLVGWSDPDYGVKEQLPMLKQVHIEAYSSVESIARMRHNLKSFKSRLEPIKFEVPADIRAKPNGQEMDPRGTHWAKENQNNHRWMEAVKSFRLELEASYSRLRPSSSEYQRLEDQSIKVALIDDGVNPSRLHTQSVLKKGWPLNPVYIDHRNVSTYYNSSEGHGTTMANLILTVCPRVHLYVAKLERRVPKSYTSVVDMAAEAVRWAVSEKVDVISMSWTIKPNDQNLADVPKLTAQIQKAEAEGISLFCSSDDIGTHTETTPLLPASSTLLKRVGSCNGNGTRSEFVSIQRDVHYLFPGEQLPAMHHHLKVKESRETGDRGSSASTALAAGLAALILCCAVRSGVDKGEFENKRMYALFDTLKVEQNTASLVDVSNLMKKITDGTDTSVEAVRTFVERLQERIPDQLREYYETLKATQKD